MDLYLCLSYYEFSHGLVSRTNHSNLNGVQESFPKNLKAILFQTISISFASYLGSHMCP